ncbi:Alpha-ketoglutarate-dependent dioxygenase-like protein [Cyphellophora attinorum]|uniref:Alpha-ketoglutarate-dependent dioxygenase-like protein n=1 Tax=Cyphellophora attinorum TaxID=1664694 RepID=A0A0N0NL52_9EURO|nr:Alpha-ketoglutarate-dependent dioxygenase-like protein [Phialophora attinorum]KPI38778.1 Alpha-ketoglutarate-dependent dioxygenase-like protein [Phialophora attinorum]
MDPRILQDHIIPSLPPTAYYIPSFLSPSESTHIFNTITSLPPHKWHQLTHRRLLSLPSPLTGTNRDNLLATTPLPTYLTDPILTSFSELGIFHDSPHKAPNHVLVNEYQPGQGIMPHTDGPAYWPVTATVSLGGHTVLDIYERTPSTSVSTNDSAEGDDSGLQSNEVATRRPKWRVLQEPGSLLVTTGELYTETLHGIAEVEVDEDLGPEEIANWDLLGDKAAYEVDGGRKRRETRISLTYRDVRKVSKGLKFLGKR